MPAQTAKSRFTSVLKANAATPVDWGDDFGELPGGINANEGIAALSSIRIQAIKQGKDQGKPLLFASGIVESPAEATTRKMVWNHKTKKAEVVEGTVKVVKVKNLRTQIMMKMYATDKDKTEESERDNIEKANVVMKRLFGQNFIAENGIETDEDLEAFLEAASKADPPIRFRFSTQWNPPHEGDDGTVYEDGVWPHKWHGTQGLEDVVPASSNGQANKEEAKQQQPAPDARREKVQAAAEAVANRAENTAKPPQDGKELDLDVMAQKAENKDMDARKRLREAALAQGWTSDQIDDPTTVGLQDTWADVAKMAKSGPVKEKADEAPGHDDAPQDQPEWVPAVGDQCWVQLRDKNGKPAMGSNRKPKPPASGEVKKVYPKDEVADCLDADDKKTVYPKVPYTDLTQA